MTALAYLPDDHQAFALARRTLRQPVLTDEQLDAAIDVLSASNDWMDCLLVREARKAVELRKVQAVFRSEETPASETSRDVLMRVWRETPTEVLVLYIGVGTVVLLKLTRWL